MFKKVLIAVDISMAQETQKLLTAAKELTANWESALHVCTVIPDYGMPIVGSYFDEGYEAESRVAAETQLSTALNDMGITATQHVHKGRIYDSIISLAASLGVDLILIGAHQPELRDYLLGANAARVVRHAKQSVLVLRD